MITGAHAEQSRGSESAVQFPVAAKFRTAKTEWAGAVREGFQWRAAWELDLEEWIYIWRDRD